MSAAMLTHSKPPSSVDVILFLSSRMFYPNTCHTTWSAAAIIYVGTTIYTSLSRTVFIYIYNVYVTTWRAWSWLDHLWKASRVVPFFLCICLQAIAKIPHITSKWLSVRACPLVESAGRLKISAHLSQQVARSTQCIWINYRDKPLVTYAY